MTRLRLMDLRSAPTGSPVQAGVERLVHSDGLDLRVRHLRPWEDASIPEGPLTRTTVVLTGFATLVSGQWRVELEPLQGFVTSCHEQHRIVAGSEGATILSASTPDAAPPVPVGLPPRATPR